jgi:hypothetical protein
MNHRIAASALALAICAAPLSANDREAALPLGGLVLVQNDSISMDSEDLYISVNEIRVRYRFTNRSSRDIETTVSFPVPARPGKAAEREYERTMPALAELEFRTTVDGKPAQLTAQSRAEVGGRDVTARVKELGWPLDWFDYTGEVPDFIKGLTAQQKSAYLREGLLRRVEASEDPIPAWDFVTHITRRQLFPAGRTVEVTHRYKPQTGGTVAGALAPESRGEDWGREYAARYCIDRSFYAGLDRRLATLRKSKSEFVAYGETWIDYILSSGRNWRGPIGSFRLVVDKGSPGNLVSFCMDGVKKISPTQFEVRRTNFEPSGDLHIMIVDLDRRD